MATLLATPLLPATLRRDAATGSLAVAFHAVSHADPVLRFVTDSQGEPKRSDVRLIVGVVVLPAGCEASEAEALRDAFASRSMVPVFVHEDVHARAVHGYARSVLWPILHSSAYTTEYVIEAHFGGCGFPSHAGIGGEGAGATAAPASPATALSGPSPAATAQAVAAAAAGPPAAAPLPRLPSGMLSGPFSLGPDENGSNGGGAAPSQVIARGRAGSGSMAGTTAAPPVRPSPAAPDVTPTSSSLESSPGSGACNESLEYLMFDAYRAINAAVAAAVVQVARPGDCVLVHGHELLLAPALLRPKLPHGCCTALFLHLPFPSPELYRVLGQRREILQGMCAADVVGFHTTDYARYFLASAVRILGVEVSARGVHIGGRFVHVFVGAVGIDPARMQLAVRRPEGEALGLLLVWSTCEATVVCTLLHDGP